MSLNYAGRAWAIITNAAGAAGTSLVLTTGHGARFQDGVQTTTARISKLDDPGSVEWVTITNRGTDTITVTRNSDGGGALTVTAGAYALDVVDDLGPWHSLAFDAGFFVPSGGGSLTIVAGNVISHAWRRVGFTVNYRLKLKNFSVVGIVNSIAVLFPTAAMPAGALREEGAYPVDIFDNSGSVAVLGYALWAAGATGITIAMASGAAFTASASLTTFGFNFPIEVA